MKKKILHGLCLTLGASFFFATACSGFGGNNDGNNDASSSQNTAKENLIIENFDAPVSLSHDEVNNYLAQTECVTVFQSALDHNFRYDQGKPVTIRFSLPDSHINEDIFASEIDIYADEAHTKLEKTQTFISKNNSVNVYNLKTGTAYYFELRVTLENGDILSGSGAFETAKGVRFLHLDGASNARDIGGWKTEDGKTIKQGLLYRGGEIDGGKNTGTAGFCLTEKGIEEMRALGIKTDLDLRSETNKVGEYSILGADVNRTFYDFWYYEQITYPEYAHKVKALFTDLANPDAYPIYLHCTHGVDRAGTASALIEGLLGVSEADIIRDYELSNFYYHYRHVDRNFDENGGSILGLLTALQAFEGETLSEKVETFLLGTGVTQQQIDTVRDIFLN